MGERESDSKNNKNSNSEIKEIVTREEAIRRIVGFLSLPPRQRALRALGIDLPPSLSLGENIQHSWRGRVMDYLDRYPSCLGPISEGWVSDEWERGFSLNSEGGPFNLPPEMFLGVACGPARGKRVGGDIAMIRVIDDPPNAGLAFLIADCITPVVPIPSGLANLKEEIERRVSLIRGGPKEIGADELLALLLYTLPISNYLGEPDALEKINSALGELLAAIGSPPTPENSYQFPGLVAIAGKVERDTRTLILQGVGDVRVALMGADGSFILSPDSFAQGRKIDDTTVALMYLAWEKAGRKGSWWDYRNDELVRKWLEITYRNKYREGVVTAINGLPDSLRCWRLEYPLVSLAGIGVFTDGLLYTTPPSERNERLFSFFRAVKGFGLRHHVRPEPQDPTKNEYSEIPHPRREKPEDDLACLFVVCRRADFVKRILSFWRL